MHETTERRSYNLFYLAVAFTILVLGIDLGINILLANPQQEALYSDIVSPIIDLIATVALFIAARRSSVCSRRLAIAWGMVGLSALAFALGDISWGILEQGLREPPFPSIADTFYLAYYPLLLIGVYLLPQKPTAQGDQIKRMLDVGIVMVASILGFWNFLLGPIIAANTTYSPLELGILLAYPVGDLVLLWALLEIIYKQHDHQHDSGTPTFLLAASIMATIIGDCLYTYQTLAGTYVSGGILDMTWRATMLLTGLAGVAQITAIQLHKNAEKFPTGLETFISKLKASAPYFSYTWLVIAYILLVRSSIAPLPMDFLSLSLAVGGIIALVLMRQIITLLENTNLNAQLQLQTLEMEKTNQELENEIVERKAVERQLTHDSLHDAMTGLPNRVLFLDRLGQAIEYGKRRTEDTFAILFVDIDQFKVINDSLGHLTGDQLLISIAQRMKENLRTSDTIARFGGDEFAVLLQITGEQDSAEAIAEKMQQAIKRPFKVDGHELFVTASIGIVPNVVGYDHPQEVLRDADIAMYQAKGTGKAHSEIFDISMRSQVFSRLEIEQDLRTALDDGEFKLYFQPILNMQSNQVTGFEALIRWQHPKRGLLLPEEFLYIAEESGLILPIGKWVLKEACSQLSRWHREYPLLQNVSMSVNVSNKQFSQSNFVEEVVDALQANDLNAECLKLEITETVLISNYEAANEIFTQLRNMGIQLQIDDFGSGYSALAYLQHFPISAVKIDKSFIDQIGKGQRGTELIRAIVSMTRELGMDAIAEGIETPEQLNQLKELLCSFGQGFLLSEPLDEIAIEKILKNC